MDPTDVLLGIACTAGALGFAAGMIVSMIGTLWLRDCPHCHARTAQDGRDVGTA